MDWIGISAVSTAVMAIGTFLTILQAHKFDKARKRIEWNGNFRQAAADMSMAVDMSMARQISQDMLFGRFDEAVAKGMELENTVNRSSFVLSSVLKEYDVVFNEHRANKYLDEVNRYVSSYSEAIGELCQFANICKFLKEKSDGGYQSEGVASVSDMLREMEDCGYHLIANFILAIGSVEDINAAIHDAIVQLQTRLANLKTEGLETVLLHIDALSGKRAYGNKRR